MTTFPAIAPASRSFTPGDYPIIASVSLSGSQSIERQTTAMVGSTLRLSWPYLSQSDRVSIETHYADQQGGFYPFELPDEILSGFTASDYTITGYRWNYAAPPEIEHHCGPYYSISVELISVPDEGVYVSGMTRQIVVTFQPGAAGGPTELGTIALSFTPGAVTTTTPIGTVVVTFQGGAATT